MDTDEVMLQLDRLQGKVENLIQRCRALESDNTDLRSRVQELESELDQKTEAENQFSRQKAQIRSKIDDLLAKLDSVAEDRAAEE